jgi:hypothetical protein
MPEQLNLTDFISPDWFKDKNKSAVWIRSYRIFRIPMESIKKIETINLSDVKAVILPGILHYLDTKQSRIEHVTETDWPVNLLNVKEQDTFPGVYLILLTPSTVDGNEIADAVIEKRLKEVVGLLMVLNGRNIAFEHIYDNIITFEGNKISATSQVTENPLVFPAPIISSENFNKIKAADTAIQSMPPNEKNRILLSLHWFESAMRSSKVNSFLSFWIALETLGMEDTNIRPLNKSLAQIYSLPSHVDANNKFGLGRIFGLRSRIVHKGHIVPIHQNLQRYLETLYTDIFLAKLGLEPNRYAEIELNKADFNLSDYLHE